MRLQTRERINDMKRRSSMTSALLVACAIALGAAAALELKNAGFESPPGAAKAPAPTDWTIFAYQDAPHRIGVTTRKAHGGKQSVHLASIASKDAYQGLFQSLPVTPGTSYRLSVHVLSDAESRLSGTARGQISIEWKGDDGKEIDRAWGPDWGASLPSEKWTKQEMTAKAPIGAASAHFVITLHEGTGSSGGAYFADDVAVEVAP